MKSERNYIDTWGYELQEILAMPRPQFASMYGSRFLGYSDSKMLRVLRQETPYIKVSDEGIVVNTTPDRLINRKEAQDLKMVFTFDEVSQML